LVKDETKAFFGSIKTSADLERTDQYTNTASSGGVSKIVIFGGGGLVLLLVGYFIYRKKSEPAMS
jgi:cellobiose-specific phosphotransferase system component IIC